MKMKKPFADQWIILADVPPAPEPEALKLYLASGINTYVLTEDFVDFAKDPVAFDETLDILDSSGLSVFVRGMGYDIFPHYFEKFADYNFYRHSSVKGFYLIDEPGADKFAGIAKEYVGFVREHYPDLFWHLNLLPSYATDEQLATSAEGSRSAFEVYIDRYRTEVLSNIKGARDIGFDHYPLYVRHGVYSVSEKWLSDLMTVGIAAKHAHARFSVCIQAFTGKPDGWNPPEGWRLPTRTGILFQLYLSLAFGASIFEIFLYRDAPDFDLANGMLGVDGTPNPTYFMVQDALVEVKKLEPALMKSRWQGVYPVAGEKATLPEVGMLSMHPDAIRKLGTEIYSSHDVILGVFTYRRKTWILAVNYTDPENCQVNRLKVGNRTFYLKPGGAAWFPLSEEA